MEAQWGPLERYAGIMTTAGRNLLVSGLQLGNVFVGVQPALGVEGDPMRLLFDRWGGVGGRCGRAVRAGDACGHGMRGAAAGSPFPIRWPRPCPGDLTHGPVPNHCTSPRRAPPPAPGT